MFLVITLILFYLFQYLNFIIKILILIYYLSDYNYKNLSFTAIIDKCDYIYNHSPSNSQLNPWDSIKNSHEEPGGDGVRYFSIDNNKSKSSNIFITSKLK
jgi:hypothetical protein